MNCCVISSNQDNSSNLQYLPKTSYLSSILTTETTKTTQTLSNALDFSPTTPTSFPLAAVLGAIGAILVLLIAFCWFASSKDQFDDDNDSELAVASTNDDGICKFILKNYILCFSSIVQMANLHLQTLTDFSKNK